MNPLPLMRQTRKQVVTRVLLFLKGICMGIADVIPGVSGGTMALILGIYEELIDALRNFRFQWVPPLLQWLWNRSADDRRRVVTAFRRSRSTFLLTLGTGILTAVAAGGMVLPPIIRNYPVMVRAFFFGLIVASLWVPGRMVRIDSWRGGVRVVLIGGSMVLLGYWLTNPARPPMEVRTVVPVQSNGETLEQIVRGTPSSGSPRAVYRMGANQELQTVVPEPRPLDSPGSTRGFSRHSPPPSAEETRYGDLHVPTGVTVHVPTVPDWYVFLAGTVAICAMILPGISGSYLLLILGAYLFVLQALRGALTGIAGGTLPWYHLYLLALFGGGAVLGLVLFTRVLHYLLGRWRSTTMAALIGLMIGCLRGIWPFRQPVGSTGGINVWPATFDGDVGGALLALVAGLVIVGALTFVRSRTVQQSLRTESR